MTDLQDFNSTNIYLKKDLKAYYQIYRILILQIFKKKDLKAYYHRFTGL